MPSFRSWFRSVREALFGPDNSAFVVFCGSRRLGELTHVPDHPGRDMFWEAYLIQPDAGCERELRDETQWLTRYVLRRPSAPTKLLKPFNPKVVGDVVIFRGPYEVEGVQP